MSTPPRILTREQFIAALDTQLAKEREATIDRFDRGAAIYGDCDLTSRNWLREAYEEHLDERVYVMFEAIREERDLPCSPPSPQDF